MKHMFFIIAIVGIIGAGQVASSKETSDKQRLQQKRDQLHAAIQGICPVTGKRLGSHGTPIKVKVGKQKIHLCCKACLKQKLDRKHWGTIHANFARAQQKCPVMNKPLPRNPKWTIVDGQIIYICCPPCTDKITAAPEKYLRKIDEYYATSLKVSKASR